MRITWVTRSFLDYRIPVFAALDELCGHELTVIYNRECTSDLLAKKIDDVLGKRAIGMSGELRLATTRRKNVTTGFANNGIRIPYQPGLIKALNASMPEVMLSDGFMQWTYATLWKRFLSRKVLHVMLYERTAYTERNCQWYRKLYRKFVMQYIDAYGANGKLCGEYLESLGVKPDSIFYGQMSADTAGLQKAVNEITNENAYAFRRQFHFNGKLFLYVGQIIPRKGVRQLLDAWKNCHFTDDGLVLVGDGEEAEELKRLNVPGVYWMGRQPYDKIQQYYRIADVFVMPTLEDNWSLVVPEAMACGLPVACSKYNGCWPELVKPENGWVFDPLDISTCSKLLKNIATIPNDDLVQMGMAGRRIVSFFSPEAAAHAIFDSCNHAVNK